MSGEAAPSILAVDDKPDNLNLLCRILKERGYRVRPVTSGELAIQAALSDAPDLVLLDISMPEMDGFAVCARLKAEPSLAEVPVIFLSAHTDVSDKVRAFEAGGVDYVTKPFQAEEIHARVAAHLELRRQRRRLEENYVRLAELERLRDSLVHMLVHDMRSPLSGICMALEILAAARPPLPASSQQVVAQCLASAGKMIQMVTGMLDVSKLESAAMTLDLTSCDLNEIARAAEADTRTLAAGKTVVVRVPAAATLVTVDRTLIGRVMQNLLSNALRFTPSGGTVFIDVTSDDTGARVSVTDSGPGVPEEFRTRIFEKFGAVQHEGASGFSTGLGLPFCRMAVEAHGGAIGVEPGPGGDGSSFRFTLPHRPAVVPAE